MLQTAYQPKEMYRELVYVNNWWGDINLLNSSSA